MKILFKYSRLALSFLSKIPTVNIYSLVALSILTLIAIVSYKELRQISLQQDANTVLINVSGYQRALSLNVMLVANLLIEEPDATQRISLQTQLSDLITQMQRSHADLTNGMLPGNLSSPLSPTMQTLYFDPVSGLDKQVNDYLLWATHLSTSPIGELNKESPDYVALLAAWPEMVAALDNAVTQYSLGISARTYQSNQQEIIFLLSALGAAGIITIYIITSIKQSLYSNQLKLLSEIDSHREAQQILLRNETLYRLLARNLPNTAVLMFDQDLRYLVVEGEIMEQAGFPKDRMEGKTIYDVLSLEAAQKLVPYYEAALAGQISDFEMTAPNNLIYHIHSVPIKADQGRIIGGMLTIHDITERKHAEEKLREQERFIQQIATAVPDIIYIYDLTLNRNIYANRELGEVIGYSQQELQALGEKFLPTTMHPDDLTHFIEHVQALSHISDGDSLEFEYRMKSPQGTWRWFNSRDTVFSRDENGRLTQILGVARNIDHRRQTENELQKREHFIEQIAATIPDTIYIFDLELRSNTYANRAFGEAIGYDAKSIAAMGDDFMRLTMHPEDWRRFPGHFVRLTQAADNTVIEFDYRMKTPRGDWLWLNSRDIVFTREADGRVTQILGVARDITKGKVAQDALMESEERFRQIAETVRSVFWIVSPDDTETFYISPAYEMIWGHSTMEIYNKTLAFADAIHPDDRERVLGERKANLTRGTYNIEYRIIRPDGTIRWINSRAYPVMNEKGDVERIIGVSDDITERKELEMQAFAIAVEREHVRVLSSFIRDTSHDLRTPLTIMTTSLYVLRRLTDPQKQAERIDQIEKQMKHLNQIISDLHEMSHLDTVSQIQLSSVDVNRLIEDLKLFYQTSIFKKDQTLVFNLESPLPLIRADAEQIKHAIMNIIDNAILYTNIGGTITITTTHDDSSVIVAIRDTGIGIGPEHHEKIFDRFYKVDAARTSGRGGPGLGLSMVKRIIAIHDGRVEVESALGEGSLFRFYLPIQSSLSQ